MGLTQAIYEARHMQEVTGLTYKEYMSKIGGKGGKKTNQETRSPKGAAAWTRDRQRKHAETYLWPKNRGEK